MSPIFASLRHHRLTVLLLVLQVAFTCAIVCNIAFILLQRLERISVVSGVDEAGLSLLDSQPIDQQTSPKARQEADLQMLRGLPGVSGAVAVSTLPLGRDEDSGGICASLDDITSATKHRSLEGANCVQPAWLQGSPGELDLLGLHLIAGRDLRPEEYGDSGDASAAVVSRALADRLFPAHDALGKAIYSGASHPIRIVGIVDTLLRPNLNRLGSNQYTMLMPLVPASGSITYVLRSAPADRDTVLKAAVAGLHRLDPTRIIAPDHMLSYTQLRQRYFQRDTTMIGLLLASGLSLLFVTALGIGGLANFWVQQRRRTIGIRRAIGATRGAIVRYFQLENLLIVSFGVCFGLALALLLNLLLMQLYELPRLPLVYLASGALGLWLLGQLSVLAPALRAAAVPPVVATRSV